MFTVEIIRLPSEVASMLMVRNRDMLPLRWQTQPNRRGKNALDEMSDQRLLGDTPIIDDSATASVRALLYLWNGWPDDAKMHAQLAPQNERLYVTAFCERMLGRWEAARQLFKQVEEMPFLGALLECAQELSRGNDIEPVEKMLREFEESQTWDHFAFTRLLAEAAGGRLGLAGEQLASRIQLKEFELLFNHCYEEATAVRVLVETRSQPQASAPKIRKREPARKPPARHSQRSAMVGDEVGAKSRPVEASRGKTDGPVRQEPRHEATFRVICPLCGAMIELPSGAEGGKSKCTRCGGVFSVTGKAAGRPAATQSPSSEVVVCCPICQTMYHFPPSVRGSNRRCSRCGTVFSVSAK